MDKRSARAAIQAVRNAFGVGFVTFARGGGGAVARVREDRAVTLFLDVMGGKRIPDAAARAIAQADKGHHDLTGTVVEAAQRQVAADDHEAEDPRAQA
jgi:hypothetical protein